MKKKIAAVLVVIALLTLTAGGTLAFFSDVETAHNEITTGKIDIELIETTLDDAGLEIPWPPSGATGAMPGDIVVKKVEIKNREGGRDCWVRVKATVSASLPNAPASFVVEPDKFHFNYNTAKWTEGGDGFWYYNGKLAPGETTEPLFTQVEFDPGLGDEYAEATVDIDIVAQAVQTANNPASAPFEALRATGWPA